MFGVGGAEAECGRNPNGNLDPRHMFSCEKRTHGARKWALVSFVVALPRSNDRSIA